MLRTRTPLSPRSAPKPRGAEEGRGGGGGGSERVKLPLNQLRIPTPPGQRNRPQPQRGPLLLLPPPGPTQPLSPSPSPPPPPPVPLPSRICCAQPFVRGRPLSLEILQAIAPEFEAGGHRDGVSPQVPSPQRVGFGEGPGVFAPQGGGRAQIPVFPHDQGGNTREVAHEAEGIPRRGWPGAAEAFAMSVSLFGIPPLSLLWPPFGGALLPFCLSASGKASALGIPFRAIASQSFV